LLLAPAPPHLSTVSLHDALPISVDTVPPTIIARNLINGKNVSTQAKIDFTIRDNLSGIQSFDGYIDGKWVLMEYDSKNRHLWHRDRKSTRLNSSHVKISYAFFCL